MVIVQRRQTSNVDDGDLYEFVVGTYQSYSSDIVDILTDLLKKEQSDIHDTRQAEYSAAHNFAMLEQFLGDMLTQDTKVLKKANTVCTAALAAEKTDLADVWKRLVALKASQAVGGEQRVRLLTGVLQELQWCHLRGVHQGVGRTSSQTSVDCWLVS